MKKFPLKRKVLNLTLALILLTFGVTRAAFSQAFSETTNEFVPLSQTSFVPCANGGAGELVTVTGTLHIQTHVTINQNRLMLRTLFQPQGASGLGLTTGDLYHGTGMTQFLDTIPNPLGAQTSTFTNNFRFIGPGPDNNLQIHQNIHITVNANGEVTSEVDNASIECN
jgi:hypothetical protein